MSHCVYVFVIVCVRLCVSMCVLAVQVYMCVSVRVCMCLHLNPIQEREAQIYKKDKGLSDKAFWSEAHDWARLSVRFLPLCGH